MPSRQWGSDSGSDLPDPGPVHRLGQSDANRRVAEERLAGALVVERHKRVCESPDVLDRHVGPSLKQADLLRLQAPDEVCRPVNHSADRSLRIRGWVGAQDQVIEVRLRIGERVAGKRDRQRADGGDFERPRPDRPDPAERARRDGRRRQPREQVLGDDPDPKRQGERGARGAQVEHHLVRPPGCDPDLTPRV
jgi:hypothetical protein